MHTANLLVKEAQGLWKQFNLRSEGEKRLSEHDHNVAMQVYNAMLNIRDAACGVRAMEVKESDRFDVRNMVDIAAPIKAKDKHLRGCVAWVEEPGFYDAMGIWQAKVAVYGDK